jgi:uroporphyrinogen decarboxylase
MNMDKYNHRERVQMILAGETPDRFAASFWRHFYHLEHHAEGTIEAMVGFQKMFDWDFMKLNPRAEYHVQGWGQELDYSHHEHAKHTKKTFPVTSVDDWARIQPLPLSSPPLAEHLKVVAGIRKALGKELPILMTVFTPLSVAGRMVEDRQTLVDHLSNHPDKVEPALDAIGRTFAAFASELRNAGADGLFYATTHWASADLLTWKEYERFGVPFDLKVIEATEESALNLLHICASNNYLAQLSKLDYHSGMFNWDSCDPTNLPLDRAYDQFPHRTLVGGIDQNGWLKHSNPDEIKYQIDRLKGEHDSSRLIIGPGCSMPPEVPMENLRVIRDNL